MWNKWNKRNRMEQMEQHHFKMEQKWNKRKRLIMYRETAIVICFVPLVPFHSGTEQTEQKVNNE
jgi:hypothetical protein